METSRRDGARTAVVGEHHRATGSGQTPLLARLDGPRLSVTFDPASGELVPISGSELWNGFVHPLGRGGRTVYRDELTREPDGTWLARILRLDLETGRVEAMPYVSGPGELTRLHYAPSTDGDQLAVSERVHAELGRPQRVVLSLLDIGSGQVTTLFEGADYSEPRATDLSTGVRWSPDGSMVAFDTAELQPELGWTSTVRVYEVSTGALVVRSLGGHLAGSLPWSQDGRTLLVDRDTTGAHLLDIDSGALSPIPALPDPVETARDPLLLGFAGDQLLVLSRRGSRHTISIVDPDSGAKSPVLRVVGPPLFSPYLHDGSVGALLG